MITLSQTTLAHNGALGLYTDPTLTSCSAPIGPFEQYVIKMYYVRDAGPDLGNAVDFRLEASIPDALFLGTEWTTAIQVTLGDILTGISLTSSQCMGANESVVYIGAITIMYTGFNDAELFTIMVKEDPGAIPPGIFITECFPGNPTRSVLGETFVFNGNCPPSDPLPNRPSGLTGAPLYSNCSLAALHINWNRNIESDISHYNIYKDVSEDFVPGPGNLLASPVDTFFYDGQWSWTPFVYYKISAIDSNDNESNFALLRPNDVAQVEPSQPSGLMGTPWYYNGNLIALVLGWNHNVESCISHYNIYKDISEDFTPGLFNLLASPVDTFFYDGQWSWTPFVYYKISAIDSNDNESNFALLRPDDVTGAETPLSPEVTYLAQNFPNPFNPTTRIAFALKAPGSVSLRIYNTTGRLVRVLVEGDRAAGQYSELWDGKDSSGSAVASGIYFYKLDAGAFTQTRKLVLLR
jgi:hypothetical protein